MSGPNPLRVAWSIVRALVRTRRPRPSLLSTRTVDHTQLAPILTELESSGSAGLAEVTGDIDRYLAGLAELDPDVLGADEALAYWLNLYNAGALRLVARASAVEMDSVLRVPGGFESTIVTVAGESLSLDAIEHGKIRRFRDPRIHGALVCGSVSCPTLRGAPYTGEGIAGQLDEQMRTYLSSGGVLVASDEVMLSRVFLWYGPDFVKPQRMPTFFPASKRAVAASLVPWLPEEAATAVRAGHPIAFQPYDWGLRCAVR